MDPKTKSQLIAETTEQNKTSLAHKLAYFIFVFVNFGLVLPVTTLPTQWQHQIIIIIIGAYTALNLVWGFRRELISKQQHRYLSVWTLYTVCLLLIATTGLLSSSYFFLVYLVILVASYAAPFASVVSIVMCFSALMLHDFSFSSFPSLSLSEILPHASKLFSLFVYTPLVVFLASRYEHADEESDKLTITEQLLRTYEEEDETLLDTISAGVIIVDHNLRIAECSRPACLMLKNGIEDMIGQYFFDRLTLLDSRHQDVEIGKGLLLAAIFQGKKTENLVCYVKNEKTSSFKIKLNIRPISGEADHAVGAIIIFEDAQAAATFEKNIMLPPLPPKKNHSK